MGIIINTKINQAKKRNYFCMLATSLLVCTLISGCTVNKVSLLTRQPTGASIKASEVKLFPRFNDIKEPCRIEGMISAYTLPIVSNTVEKRVALIKETAADLGINAIIGLQDDIKFRTTWNERSGPGRSNALLATTGSARQQNAEALPKFIVCLPALNFKIEKIQDLGLLDEFLREHILYTLGYQKGYYVYKCDAPGVDNAGILNGSASIEALAEPISIPPDFALLCDVEGYDERGNIVISRSKTLRLAMTLYDLKEKKAVWTSTTEGISTKSIIGSLFVGGLPALLEPDEFKAAIAALTKTIDNMPSVKGFRRGPESKY
jgi:hypothetical protein